jgi:retron-type reverse transcriptase
MRIIFSHGYDRIISLENLLEAWREFASGKRSRHDVQMFELNLMDNLLSLHNDLKSKTYQHANYEAFRVSDPKPRSIHKASVRDRLLHRALYRILYPFFDRTFIYDSYSCRFGKGTHKALDRFRSLAHQVSKNHTKTVWVLKCDVRKFFASIDHDTLVEIIKDYVFDADTLFLLSKIIRSFHSTQNGVGLPLGNLTSQLFANVYLNQLDQFVKNKIKARYYLRYADDFVVMSQDKNWLLIILSELNYFLLQNLKLVLHPDKISIKTLASGIDFLGWVHFPDHRVLRRATRRRMFKNIERQEKRRETIASYLGLINHGNTYKLKIQILNAIC